MINILFKKLANIINLYYIIICNFKIKY